MRRGAVLLLVLGAASCGGSDEETASESSRIADAAAKTIATETARQSLTVRVPPQVDLTMSGVIDFTGDAMQTRITYWKLLRIPGGHQADMISINEIEYFRARGSPMWIRTKRSIEDQFLSVLDSSSALGHLGEAIDDASEHPGEDIGGEPTTRYKGTLDLMRLAEALPADKARHYHKRTAHISRTRLPVEIWIDPDDLIRRIRYAVPTAPASLGVPGPLPDTAITIHLNDFGEPARVTAPPLGQQISPAQAAR